MPLFYHSNYHFWGYSDKKYSYKIGIMNRMNKVSAGMRMAMTKAVTHMILTLAVLLLAGCSAIGPPTVARDRFDYVSAISESWKQQMLLNLLKTRYVDAPVFMDVTSVISQYAVEGQVQLGATWAESPLGNFQNVTGSGKYTDRPTITYAPLMGEKFTKSLMTPIPVPGLLFLLQSGYPADFVFRVCVHTVNGIENRYGAALSARAADPKFHELIDTLRRIQNAGGLGIRVKSMDKKHAMVMFFRPLTDKAIAGDLKKVRQLLRLDSDAREFRVSYGSFAEDDTEIAILSRSMLQIMVNLASYIDVPDSDVAEGRVYSSKFQNTETELAPLIRVQNSTSRPDDAHVSVRYRDRWFWIDDRDFPSKLTFTFIMILSSLTETDPKQSAPIVTVPTN
jgi:hypothetical protein